MQPSVTLAELEAIRDPLRESGFRGVYRHRHNWQARGGRRRGLSGGGSPVIGTYATPVDAAKGVVQWWKSTYGPRWREALLASVVSPVVIRRTPDRRFVELVAWFEGVPTTVARVPAESVGRERLTRAAVRLRRQFLEPFGLARYGPDWRGRLDWYERVG